MQTIHDAEGDWRLQYGNNYRRGGLEVCIYTKPNKPIDSTRYSAEAFWSNSTRNVILVSAKRNRKIRLHKVKQQALLLDAGGVLAPSPCKC
jgi:hypothetical protein